MDDSLLDIPERFPKPNFSLVDLRDKYNRINERDPRVRDVQSVNDYIKIEQIKEYEDTTDLRIVVDVNYDLTLKLRRLRKSIPTTLTSTIISANVVPKIVLPGIMSTNNIKITEILLRLNNDLVYSILSPLGLVEFIQYLVDDLQITINNVKMTVSYPPEGIDTNVCQLLFGSNPSNSFLKLGRKAIDLHFTGVRSSDNQLINEYLQFVKNS